MISPAWPSEHLCRQVQFGDVRYDFFICQGPGAWPVFHNRLAALDTDLFIIIADNGLPTEVIAQVEARFGAIASTVVLRTAADEKTKKLASIDELAERAIECGVTRQSCVVALGGGVVGNMAGLLAGLLYRGIRLIHLPTTLLSMSDSVLSIKQGVNSRQGKNLLGLYHPPIFVWNQLDFLQSLPASAIQSALCEAIKNVIAICPERFDEVATRLRPDGRYPARVLAEFIDLSVDAKMKLMRTDPWEKGEARILEYGHTVGHALEMISGGTLHHGFAIGLGMLAAAGVSRRLGFLKPGDEEMHRDLLVRNGAPTTLPASASVEAIMRTIQLDNKRGYVRRRPGMCDLILLDGPGKPHRNAGGGLITQVDEAVVRAAIESLAPVPPR